MRRRRESSNNRIKFINFISILEIDVLKPTFSENFGVGFSVSLLGTLVTTLLDRSRPRISNPKFFRNSVCSKRIEIIQFIESEKVLKRFIEGMNRETGGAGWLRDSGIRAVVDLNAASRLSLASKQSRRETSIKRDKQKMVFFRKSKIGNFFDAENPKSPKFQTALHKS